MLGKNICLHGEDAKIHKTKVNNDPIKKFLRSFLPIQN